MTDGCGGSISCLSSGFKSGKMEGHTYARGQRETQHSCSLTTAHRVILLSLPAVLCFFYNLPQTLHNLTFITLVLTLFGHIFLCSVNLGRHHCCRKDHTNETKSGPRPEWTMTLRGLRTCQDKCQGQKRLVKEAGVIVILNLIKTKKIHFFIFVQKTIFKLNVI